MLTALDVDPAKLDQHEQKFVAQILRAWLVRHSGVRGRGRARLQLYDGLLAQAQLSRDHYIWLKREIAHDTFWHIYRTLEQGERFAIGEPIDSIFESSEAALLPVSKRYYKDHLGWSRWFYRGDDFDCVQLSGPIAMDAFRGNRLCN